MLTYHQAARRQTCLTACMSSLSKAKGSKALQPEPWPAAAHTNICCCMYILHIVRECNQSMHIPLMPRRSWSPVHPYSMYTGRAHGMHWLSLHTNSLPRVSVCNIFRITCSLVHSLACAKGGGDGKRCLEKPVRAFLRQQRGGRGLAGGEGMRLASRESQS